jgi:hypothetical protein
MKLKSLTLREERGQNIFEIWVLGRPFAFKRVEIIRGLRKMHNE